MIFIQNGADMFQIAVIFGFLPPGNTQKPIQITQLDAGFRRSLRQHIVAAQFFQSAFFNMLGVRIVLDFLTDFLRIAAAAGVAQFFAYCLQLFAQIVFFLPFVNPLLNFGIDRIFNFTDLLLLFQLRQNLYHPLVYGQCFQQFLSGGDRHRKILGELIGQILRRNTGAQLGDDLLRKGLR